MGSGITDDYLYDLSGHFITQVSGSGTWVRGEIYANGEHIATYENDLTTPTTFFTHADHLGTERVETGVSGASCETTTSLPFGDGLNTSGSCDPTQLRFTGKQRDFESNLDNFGARYNSSSLGRFMSPDPLAGHTEDPQTMNRYSYVRNNPLSLTDPTGMDFYLSCQTASATCGKDAAGNLVQGTTTTTTDANGNPTSKFNPTVVTSASLENADSGNTATVNQNGVQITTTDANGNKSTAEGIFINGTSAANNIQGSGDLTGFTFNINGNCGGTCLSSGSWSFNGSLNAARALLNERGSFTIPFEDVVAGLGGGAHPFSTQHRFGGPLNSPHLSVPFDPGTSDYVASSAFIPPQATVPATGGFHVDAHSNWLGHLEDVWNSH